MVARRVGAGESGLESDLANLARNSSGMFTCKPSPPRGENGRLEEESMSPPSPSPWPEPAFVVCALTSSS